MRAIFRSIGAFICLVSIASCGGGSGSHGTGDPVPPDDALTGFLVDSAVSGVTYETATHRGVTGPNGDFRYAEGETVRFTLGGTLLGEVTARERLTPFDLAHSAVITGTAPINKVLRRSHDPFHAVVNLAVLLQALDDDGNPENGIKITPQVADLLQGVNLDVGQRWDAFVSQFPLRHIVGQANTQGLFSRPHGIVSQALALEHLYATLEIDPGINGLTLSEADYYGDGTVDWTNAARYDVNGNKVWERRDVDHRLGAPGLIITSSFDASGRPVQTDVDEHWDGTVDSITTYQYDVYGNLIRSQGTSGDGLSVLAVTTYQYNADGYPTRQQSAGSDGVVYWAETYRYDAYGRQKGYERDENGDGVPEFTQIDQYDARGNVTRSERDTDGDGVAEFVLIGEYQYSPDGKLLREAHDENGDGTVDITQVYEYDADGNMISEESGYDNDGDGTLDTITENWQYEYDPRGNQTRAWKDSDADGLPDYLFIAQYDANDNLLQTGQDTDRNGTADYITNYLYDDRGVVTRVEAGYDQDGDGMLDSITWNDQYDANGYVIRHEDYYQGYLWLVISHHEYEATGWFYIFDRL